MKLKVGWQSKVGKSNTIQFHIRESSKTHSTREDLAITLNQKLVIFRVNSYINI